MLVGGGLPAACSPALSPSMVGGCLLFSRLCGEASPCPPTTRRSSEKRKKNCAARRSRWMDKAEVVERLVEPTRDTIHFALILERRTRELLVRRLYVSFSFNHISKRFL
jgi:hypothetical protein